MFNEDLSYLRIAVALPVKGTFTYLVQKDLKSIARIGCRVLVPFNKRRVTGYILEIKEKTDQADLKDILEVLDPEPLFHPQMVPFFEWMADYYMHPIGRVMQSVLPAGINASHFNVAYLTEKGLKALEKLPSHYDKIKDLAWIKDNPGKRLPWPVTRVLSLQNKGWVKIQCRVNKKQTGPLRRIYVCKNKDMDLQSFLKDAAHGLGLENEFNFLEKVCTTNKILLSDLSSEFKNGAYLVNKYVKKGFLQKRVEEVYRNPAGEMLVPAPAPVKLHQQQAQSFSHIRRCLDQKTFSSCLLFGVTGSGKTEVYFHAVEHAFQLHRQAILMIPEIALAVYMEGLFRSRLGDRIAIYHSGLSQGERYDQWMRIVRGEADLVIGARSALFAPMPRLGLIIVDEEHDSSYKQGTHFRYQARDAAVVRAKMEKALVILGSGTPSVQSFQNSINGRYQLLEMPERVEKRELPEVKIIKMKPPEEKRGRMGMLSPGLKKAIQQNLEAGNQTLLFLNRRGFHRLYICRSCGKSITCPNCDVALTHHLKTDQLICHYCGFHSGTNIKCTSCGYPRLRPYGFGTEKLEQKLESLFPSARVARMDTDSTAKKGQIFKILKKFSEREVDILVGTQMITKGYDFPNVTLVGIVAADMSLGFPDFRAAERTFQILSQVAGRAGRGVQKGQVIVQTFNPEHYAINAATLHDFRLFFEKEKRLREQLGYPPFSHLAFLRFKGNNKEKTFEAAQYLARNLKRILTCWPKRGKDLLVLGPVEAPLSRLKGKYRWQILIKSKNVSLLQHLLNEVEKLSKNFLQSQGVQMGLDIDPYQMS